MFRIYSLNQRNHAKHYSSQGRKKPYEAWPPLLEMGNDIGYIIVHFSNPTKAKDIEPDETCLFLSLAEHVSGFNPVLFADFINLAGVYPDTAGNGGLGLALAGQTDNFTEN